MDLALIWLAAIVTTGGVYLLRPLVQHLGLFLDTLAEQNERSQPDNERVMACLADIDERLSLLEDGLTLQRRLSPSQEGDTESSGRRASRTGEAESGSDRTTGPGNQPPI